MILRIDDRNAVLHASRHLHRELDQIRSLPGQRIENQHGDRTHRRTSVHSRRNISQRRRRNFVSGESHHIVVPLRFLIDDADSRARG